VWLTDGVDPEPRTLAEDREGVVAERGRGRSTIVRCHSGGNQVSRTVRVNTDHSLSSALLRLQLLTVAMMAA